MLFDDDRNMIFSNSNTGDIITLEDDGIKNSVNDGYIPTVILGLDEGCATRFNFKVNRDKSSVYMAFNELPCIYNSGDVTPVGVAEKEYFRIIFTKAVSMKVLIESLKLAYDNFSDEEKEKAEKMYKKYL